MAVTELVILKAFTLEEVLDKVIKTSKARTTPLALFQQWWSTQRLSGGPGPHCLARGTFKGFDYNCPRAEGNQAFDNPFRDSNGNEAYVPVGLFPRFDLADNEKWSNCGEYRIVFARRSGITQATMRNLIIFEGVLPNPDAPNASGCLPVAKFWSRQSSLPPETRRVELHDFYLRGLRPPESKLRFSAAMDAHNLGLADDRATGQIRSNQHMGGEHWLMREFSVRPDPQCARNQPCSNVAILPRVNASNPWFELFRDGQDTVRRAFQDWLLRTDTLEALSRPDPSFTFNVPTDLSGGDASPDSAGSNYAAIAGLELKRRLSERLTKTKSPLNAEWALARATAMSCSGCHWVSKGSEFGGSAEWPKPLDHTHVSEAETVIVNGLERYRISPALETFLVHRARVLAEFLPD